MALQQWIAKRVRYAPFVGGIIAVLAFVFSTLYLFVWPGSSITKAVPGLGPVALVPLITLNAFVVTTVVWSRLVTESTPITWTRLGGSGLLAGLLSHLTLGLIASTAFLLWDENGILVEGLPPATEVPELLLGWIAMALFVGVYSIPFTFGVPVLLSVGVGIALARTHDRNGR